MKNFIILVVIGLIAFFAYDHFTGGSLSEEGLKVKLLEQEFKTAARSASTARRSAGVSGMNTTSDLAIAIEAVCLQTIEVFEYDPETRELIDIEHENMRWEVIKGNKMPRKRADKRAEFEYSDYPDYHDFCQRYATFLKEKEGTLSYSKWPDIRCLKPFEYDSSARLIIDNVKKEEWRVMDMMSFFSLQSRTRRTGWKVASYEKIKDFFDDLKEENSKGNIHEYIVNLIEDKSFWTNSSVGRERKDVIRFDLRDERPRPMQDKSLYGLVVKKF